MSRHSLNSSAKILMIQRRRVSKHPSSRPDGLEVFEPRDLELPCRNRRSSTAPKLHRLDPYEFEVFQPLRLQVELRNNTQYRACIPLPAIGEPASPSSSASFPHPFSLTLLAQSKIHTRKFNDLRSSACRKSVKLEDNVCGVGT